MKYLLDNPALLENWYIFEKAVKEFHKYLDARDFVNASLAGSRIIYHLRPVNEAIKKKAHEQVRSKETK